VVSCGRASYDFNDGTLQGFSPSTTSPPNSLGVSSAVRRGSSGYSLAVGVSLTPSSSTFRSGVEATFCSPGYASLNGRVVSAWAYVAAASFPSCGGNHDVSIRVYGSGGDGTAATVSNPPLNTWFQVSGTVTSATYSSAYRIGISLYVNCAPTWSGTLYVDDVVIGG
jgi:hypothetical protein